MICLNSASPECLEILAEKLILSIRRKQIKVSNFHLVVLGPVYKERGLP